jgi:predicted membrane protein
MSGRIVAGLIVVVVGIGLLLDARGVVEFGDLAGTYWPLILIAVGIGMLVSRPRHVTGALIIMGIGTVFLARNTGVLPGNWFSYAWPLAIIAIGILLLVPRLPRRGVQTGMALPGAGADSVHMAAYFAGAEETIRSTDFKGGSIDVAFGGAKVDLRGAGLAATGARLDANAIFGGIEIVVPVAWRVVVNARPILGGVENKTAPSASGASSGPVLEVNASATFGGVTIKN